MGSLQPSHHSEVVNDYEAHSSAQKVSTDVALAASLRAHYPGMTLSIVALSACDLSERSVQLHPDSGSVDESVYGSSAATNKLTKRVAEWTAKSHNEIWVFDQAWSKSKELYKVVQNSDWKDVILDKGTKELMIKDIEGFFNACDTYKRFGIPWKRGIIFHGPPGNGKTISIKAIMKSLSIRPAPIPSLYVKSFVSCQGPEWAISSIFQMARKSAPCFLVIEDLDSLVTDKLRSYFLNEVDGLSSNEGILILGSTNHLDKLDDAIVKRPSRFDRKYPFHSPSEPERALYAAYWKGKLVDVPEVDMSESDCAAIAGLTEGFTFAYLKEAFMATLFALYSAFEAQKLNGNEADPSVFLLSFKQKVEVLREQMNDAKDATGETLVQQGNKLYEKAK